MTFSAAAAAAMALVASPSSVWRDPSVMSASANSITSMVRKRLGLTCGNVLHLFHKFLLHGWAAGKAFQQNLSKLI